MLYPNVSKPLYEQLKQALRENIRSGLHKTDEALPGERQLMDIYKVSRMTVRQAIGDLVSEGLLYRRHGSGTFVSQQVVDRPMVKLYGTLEELKLSGHDISMRLIDSRIEDPEIDTARELQIEKGEKVFCYIRLIYSSGKPILLTKSHINRKMSNLFDNINVNIARDVIYDHLENCGYQISHAVQHLQAGNPSLEEAKLLECFAESPVLIVRRTTYIKGGYPIIYTRALYRQEYTFTMNLKR